MKEEYAIFVAGANGRMGQNIIRLVVADPQTRLVGASEHPESPVQGADAGLNAGTHNISVTIGPDLERPLKQHRGVIIDFSSPSVTMVNLERAQQYNTPIVIGTTGFTEEQLQKIKASAKNIPVVLAPNMSVGMNLVFKLVAEAARVLKDNYDIEILEAHHRHKKDAPSGTANRLAQIACEATGRSYPRDINYHRQGLIGERPKSEIGMQVIRGGDIVGEHTVLFCGDGERVEIKHSASRRTTFAFGAIRAAKWLVGKKPGLYGMWDVLGLN